MSTDATTNMGPVAKPFEGKAATLEERLRALEDEYATLTSSLSHDLQEPLRMVVGFMELLELEHAASLDESGRECVAYAADGARRMQRMLEALLTLSRASVEAIEPAVVDPAEAWALAQAQLRTEIEAHGADVSAGPLPLVWFDRRHLEVLLEELLRNAIAHSGAAAASVRLTARAHGTVTLSVEDEGVGIPPDQHERVFRPFNPRRTERGPGVGLVLARRLVHRNGGSLWLEPNQPHGLRVSFTARTAQEQQA